MTQISHSFLISGDEMDMGHALTAVNDNMALRMHAA